MGNDHDDMAAYRARRAAWAREYRKNNRDLLSAQRRARYEKKMRDPVVAEAERAYRKAYNKKYHGALENKRRKRARDLEVKYGLTVQQYEAMIADQSNLCLICGDTMVAAPIVDHCHSTGKVRGLLCKDCNTGLGHFRDNTSSLSRAITYLDRHSGLTSSV